MSKYNHFAKELDSAFRAARKEYAEAWDKFQGEKDARGKGDAMARQRAELRYKQAEIEFREAEARIWQEFNQLREELRSKLERELRVSSAANPDAIDANGLELMKSGILSSDDFYALADKYDDNPTMLRLVAKYAKDAADDMDVSKSKDRGALYQLHQTCSQGQGRIMQAWDELAVIVDYCSGQHRGRRDTPTHTINMGKWWEQLSDETVKNF